MPKLSGFEPSQVEIVAEEEYYTSNRFAKPIERVYEEDDKDVGFFPKGDKRRLVTSLGESTNEVDEMMYKSEAVEQLATMENCDNNTLEALFHIGRGTSPTATSVYRKMRYDTLSNPSVDFPAYNLPVPEAYNYPDRWSAIREACRIVRLARTILGNQRRRIDEESCLVDIQVVADRYHVAMEMAIEKLDMLNPSDTNGFVHVLAQFRGAAKDMLALCGKPIQNEQQVRFSGNVSHNHQLSNPSSAYSAWDGGLRDLGAVVDAEFTDQAISSIEAVASTNGHSNGIIQHDTAE